MAMRPGAALPAALLVALTCRFPACTATASPALSQGIRGANAPFLAIHECEIS